MNDHDASTPPMQEAVVPTHPPLPPYAPSPVPHLSPTGIIKQRDGRLWRWLERKRASRE